MCAEINKCGLLAIVDFVDLSGKRTAHDTEHVLPKYRMRKYKYIYERDKPTRAAPSYPNGCLPFSLLSWSGTQV
jgi:hypothetical protein